MIAVAVRDDGRRHRLGRDLRDFRQKIARAGLGAEDFWMSDRGGAAAAGEVPRQQRDRREQQPEQKHF